jgi:glycosyltransferase involved in cell wall biosynthesis
MSATINRGKESHEAKWLLSHPTGNVNVRQNALAMAEAGLLAEFWTCLHFDIFRPPWRWLPAGIRQTLERRSFALPESVLIRTHPWKEIARHAASALRLKSLLGPNSVDDVYQSLDGRVASRLQGQSVLKGVFCSEDGALESFRAASRKGMACIYELPIGYWRAGRSILQEEADRRPEWAMTLTGNSDSEEKLERKDSELTLASAVLVASTFAGNSLKLVPGKAPTVLVLPYAAVGDHNSDGQPEAGQGVPENASGPLKVLYVGSLTQRKGLAYLLDAVEALRPHVNLTLVGREAVEGCAPLRRALSRSTWIPSLSRPAILQQMRRHDVLVLPSLFEGFGLVLVEALSQGLPIIATNHTGAPDVIQDGKEGFIVPIRSAEAIQSALEALIRDRALLRDMQMAAAQTAQQLSWRSYRLKLARWIEDISSRL